MVEQKNRVFDCVDYAPPVTTEQAKVNSIRKILDETTFTRIKARISLK